MRIFTVTEFNLLEALKDSRFYPIDAEDELVFKLLLRRLSEWMIGF